MKNNNYQSTAKLSVLSLLFPGRTNATHKKNIHITPP